MMDYDKIYERVLRRGDKILEERRKKAVKIRQTSYAVSGVCAAVITGVGIWRMTNLKKLPENRIPEIETVEDITANTDITTTMTTSSIETKTETSKKNDTSRTSLTTSSSSSVTSVEKTTENITNTIASENAETEKTSESTVIHTETTTALTEKTNTDTITTISNSTSISAETVSESTIKASMTTSLKSTTSLLTSVQTVEVTQSATTVPANETGSKENIIITTSATASESISNLYYPDVFKKIHLSDINGTFTGEYSYTDNFVVSANVGTLLGKQYLKEQYYLNGKLNDIETTARIYEFNKYSPYVMIAVGFEENGQYYRYINTHYEPADLGELLSAYNLTAASLNGECTYWGKQIKNIDIQKTWKMLTEDTSLVNMNRYCNDNNITLYPDLKFVLSPESVSWFKGTIGIDSQGYIIIKINNMTEVSFYIGEDKADEIISFCTE